MWQIFSKIVIAPVNCQNLSKMTDFGPKSQKNLFSVKFDRFWVQNLSNLTDFKMTDFAVKICQKWQILAKNPEKICNLSNLTDSEFKICQIWQILKWQILLPKSVKNDRFWSEILKKSVFCHKSGKICHFWQILPLFPGWRWNLSILAEICHIPPPVKIEKIQRQKKTYR